MAGRHYSGKDTAGGRVKHLIPMLLPDADLVDAWKALLVWTILVTTSGVSSMGE